MNTAAGRQRCGPYRIWPNNNTRSIVLWSGSFRETLFPPSPRPVTTDHLIHIASTGCPTTYQTRQFFNNFTTDTFRHNFTTDTFLFISHATNVLLFKSRCNIFIGFGIIKELHCLVGSGTPCIIQKKFPDSSSQAYSKIQIRWLSTRRPPAVPVPRRKLLAFL